jgi:hypothetical protein
MPTIPITAAKPTANSVVPIDATSAAVYRSSKTDVVSLNCFEQDHENERIDCDFKH